MIFKNSVEKKWNSCFNTGLKLRLKFGLKAKTDDAATYGLILPFGIVGTKKVESGNSMTVQLVQHLLFDVVS